MARTIKVFVAKDSRSAQLLRDLRAVLDEIPRDKRPELKIRVLKIDDPSKLEDYLAILEELHGGTATVEFRKYGIHSLPALIVDDRKVLEGSYPSREELKEILAYEGIPVKREERALPLAVQQPVMEGQPLPQPPSAPVATMTPPHRPVEEESAERSLEVPAETQAQVVARPPAPTLEAPAPEAEAKRKAKGTCFDCVFFEAGRCLLLHIKVPDPGNPPCGRR